MRLTRPKRAGNWTALAEVVVVGRSSTHGLLLGQVTGRTKDYDDGVLLELQGAKKRYESAPDFPRVTVASSAAIKAIPPVRCGCPSKSPREHQHHGGTRGKMLKCSSSAQSNAAKQTYPALASTSG